MMHWTAELFKKRTGLSQLEAIYARFLKPLRWLQVRSATKAFAVGSCRLEGRVAGAEIG